MASRNSSSVRRPSDDLDEPATDCRHHQVNDNRPRLDLDLDIDLDLNIDLDLKPHSTSRDVTVDKSTLVTTDVDERLIGLYYLF